MLQELKTHAAANGWEAAQVDGSSLKLACPWPENTNILIGSAGEWIIAAIEQFLGIPRRATKVYSWTRFIVEHSSGIVVAEIPNRGIMCSESSPKDFCGYEILDTGSNDWEFAV